MKSKKCSLSLVIYEIRNIIGNPFTLFFGIIFPILMLIVITKAMVEEVTSDMLAAMNTQIFIGLTPIIPMAVIFLGYAATYSQEVENDIPVRMKLFGFPEHATMLAKIIAQFIGMSLGLIIYGSASYLLLDIQVPRLSSAVVLLVCLYLIGGILFLLAHGLTAIFRKFGPTYAVCMILYFLIMIMCGMMGIRTDQLPKVLQSIAALIPITYICKDFAAFWQEGSYQFAPLIQSFLFLGAVSGITLLYANYINRRILK